MPDNTKIKLPPSLVRVGHEVPVDVYGRNGLLLVKKGHYVLTPEQKERILHAGQVTVDAQAALSEREKRERRARLAEAERRAQERLRESGGVGDGGGGVGLWNGHGGPRMGAACR